VEQHEWDPRHGPVFAASASDPPERRSRVPRRCRRRCCSPWYNEVVHVHVYKLKLQPNLWSPPPLTAEAFAARLAGDAVIRSFAAQRFGGHVANVELQRDRESHGEALNELLFAVEELGYTFAEAEITKVADRAIEMAVGGAVTGGYGAGSTTQNGETAVIGGFVGWVVGLLVGANMKKVEPLYRAQLTSQGWQFVPVKPQRSAPARSALGTA
jgi:hypothetical protein